MAAKQSVEVRALEFPEVKKTKSPKSFGRFIEETALKLMFTPEMVSAQSMYDDNDERVRAFMGYFDKNPKHKDKFIKWMKSKRKDSEHLTLDNALRIHGTENVRDVIAGIELHKVVLNKPFGWDPVSLRPKFKPEKLLKYAMTARKAAGADAKNINFSYCAGLLFDILDALNNNAEDEIDPKTKAPKDPDKKDRVKKTIKETFEHGLQAAKIAQASAKDVHRLTLLDYAFAATLVHDIGKVVMTFITPGYGKHTAMMKRRSWPRSMRQFAEDKKFGIGHPVYGSLVCHYYELLRPIKEAVRYHHDPYMLKGKGKDDLYDLACMICLSTNIANNFQSPEDEKDDIFKVWIRTELTDFEIPKAALAKTIAKLLE